MSSYSNQSEVQARILEAARFHLAFDGFSEAVLSAAAADAGVCDEEAKAAFPRGAIDLAYAFHIAGDHALALAMEDMPADLRYSQKVAWAVKERLAIAAQDREAVRRAAGYFALPIHAATASRALWHTADTIWNGLGDTSDDFNWYSKRAILSGVYSASLLYWLGDTSESAANTDAFVERRIEDVMRFEKAKASARKSPLHRAFMAGPGRLLDQIRAPGKHAPDDLPGRASSHVKV